MSQFEQPQLVGKQIKEVVGVENKGDEQKMDRIRSRWLKKEDVYGFVGEWVQGFFRVHNKETDSWNYVNKKGDLISDKWYIEAKDFEVTDDGEVEASVWVPCKLVITERTTYTGLQRRRINVVGELLKENSALDLKRFDSIEYKEDDGKVTVISNGKVLEKRINDKGLVVSLDKPMVTKPKDNEKTKEIEPVFENITLDIIKLLLSRGVDKNILAKSLSGLDSEQAYLLREQLLDEGVFKGSLAEGLAGCESDRAWEMRERLLSVGLGVYKGLVLEGLAGCDSDRAWEMREQLSKEKLRVYNVLLAKGLAGCDSDRAWEMREQLIRSEGWFFYNLIAEGLVGLDSDRAWKMRDFLLHEETLEIPIAEGLAGCESDRAWEVRDYLLRRGIEINKVSVAKSLAGCESDRSWEVREQLLSKKEYEVLAISLIGLVSDRAWEVREQLLSKKEYESLAKSLLGFGSLISK